MSPKQVCVLNPKNVLKIVGTHVGSRILALMANVLRDVLCALKISNVACITALKSQLLSHVIVIPTKSVLQVIA